MEFLPFIEDRVVSEARCRSWDMNHAGRPVLYTTSVAPSVPVIVAGRACVSRFGEATAVADPGPT